MTITVNGAGGVTINFPDGTDAGTIQSVMEQASGQGAGQPPPDLGAGHAGMAGLIQGATLGWGDELSGVAAGAEEATLGALSRATGLELGPAGSQGSFQTGYDRGVQGARQELASAAANHPYVYGGGQVAGALATLPFAPEAEILPAAAQGATLAARVLPRAVNAAATGTLYGAVQGAGSADGDIGDRIAAAGEGGVLGGVTGGVLGTALGTGAEALAGRAAAQQAGPDIAGAAQRANVYVPAYVASNDPVVQQIGAAAKSIPLSGTRIVKATDRMTDDFGQSMNDVASQYGGGAALDDHSAGAAAQQALENFIGPISRQAADAMYGRVAQAVDPTITTPLNATAQIATDIVNRRGAATLPTPGPAVRQIAQAATDPNGLTYSAMQDLRSAIGEQIGNPSRLPADMSTAELKQIYDGLTTDLGNAAQNAGGQAGLRAWQNANFMYQQMQAHNQVLDKLLGTKSPEGIVNAILAKAGSGRAADIQTLGQIQRSMPPDVWDGIASAAVNRMMNLSPATGQVSMDKFFTAWNQLSPAGKQALFGNQPQMSAKLNDLAQIAGRAKATKAYSNPSGTAQVGAFLAMAPHLLHPAAWPHFAAAGIGGSVLARALTRPATAGSVAPLGRLGNYLPNAALYGMAAPRALPRRAANAALAAGQNPLLAPFSGGTPVQAGGQPNQGQ